MFEQLKIITDIIDHPFALYQEQTCIFESKIDNSDVLTAFTKNFWDASKPDILTLNHFRGLFFPSIKFLTTEATYLFILVISEKEFSHLSKEQQTFFFRKILACIAILSDQQKIVVKNMTEIEIPSHPQESKKKQFSIRTDELESMTDFTDNYQLEKIFIQTLKEGDLLLLNKIIQKLSQINRTSLSNDKILEKKFRFTSLVTLITRASVNYGCPPATAYRLSDKFILKLDFIERHQDFAPLTNQMLTEFSLLIKTRTVSYTPMTVKSAVEYIYQNLYEELSNTKIAAEINVHPAYLSSIFKKTVGKSLRKFIINARIHEAKYLLSNTDLPFKEISESLHFSNQSYFCKLFKEATSYTPKEFRILF